jgi:hypothetical protein
MRGAREAQLKQRRQQRLSAELAVFLRQHARPAAPGLDPNDRRCDRKLERMDPRALDELTRLGEPEAKLDERTRKQRR